MSRRCDRDASAELAHALGISCEDFTSGAADILLRHLALHAQAARIEGAKAMQEAAKRIAEGHRTARQNAAKLAKEGKRRSEARDHESMAIEAAHIVVSLTSLDPQTIAGEAG